MRSLYVSVALKLALELIPEYTFMQCCDESISRCSTIGFNFVKNGQTVRRWHKMFCDLGNKFVNPASNRGKKNKLPSFLENNPDIVSAIKQYSNEIITDLSRENLYNYIYKMILPSFVIRRQEETGNNQLTIEDVLKENGLVKLSVSTVYRWMKAPGYSYSLRCKKYYVDNHEKKENLIYWKDMIGRYFELEQRCYRWVQISADDRNKLVQKKDLKADVSYKYTDANGSDMYKFHVDDSDKFEVKNKLGGDLSVRMLPCEKPVIMLGQDECIFKQNSYLNRQWVLPDGTKALVLKSDGYGIMISAFQS